MTVTGHAAEREPLVVLSVEDDPQFGALLRRVLEAEGFEVTIERVQSRGELESALQRRSWDVVLSDHSMPGFSSTHALQVIKARGLDIPFIIVSGYIGEENAVAVMRAGAYDYVPKTGLNRLGVAVRNARNAASERALLRQRERDLEALHAVAFAAGSALDAGRLATFASERARELLQTDTSSVYWWDPDTLVLDRIARSTTRTDEGIARLLVGDSMAGRAFEQREAMVVDDYPTWPHRSKDTSAVRSGMAVPMFIGDRAVGAFTATSMVPRRFSASEIRVLSVLAAEVAPAIETSRLVAAAQYAASYDSLTGLPNRALFTARLEAQTAECAAQGRSFALIFADLDDFREINDAFGRDAGNAVLRELGVRLRGLGGVGDAVGRFGGDEFGMRFPPGSDVAFATRAAEAAIEFLKEPFVVEGQSVHLAASIGIVGFPEHGTTAEILLQRAEEAMVAAKRSRARHRVYTSDLDPHSQQRIALVTELRRAMTERQLVLHYQPQVDVPTGRIVAAEALLRWRHPHRGLVPPMDFIGLAEQTGLILELTPWVITAPAAWIRHFDARGPPGLDQRFHARPSGSDLPRTRREADLRVRRRTELAHVRDHRRDDHARGRADPPSAGRSPRAGLGRRDRRLRHRVLVAELPGSLAGRRGQDRQVVRDVDRCAGGPGDRLSGDRDRAGYRRARRRGGRQG